MRIKLELEKHEWEAVMRLVHKRPLHLHERTKRSLLNKLIDARIEEALAAPDDQDLRYVFNFLIHDNGD
jgi:hypothetical protein